MLLEVLDAVFFSVVVFKKEVFTQVVAGKDLVSILLADFLINGDQMEHLIDLCLRCFDKLFSQQNWLHESTIVHLDYSIQEGGVYSLFLQGSVLLVFDDFLSDFPPLVKLINLLLSGVLENRHQGVLHLHSQGVFHN